MAEDKQGRINPKVYDKPAEKKSMEIPPRKPDKPAPPSPDTKK